MHNDTANNCYPNNSRADDVTHITDDDGTDDSVAADCCIGNGGEDGVIHLSILQLVVMLGG